MKISIIIPIYNVEPYIARCLQSVMDQTYGGPVECLLVDDCGNDKSVALAEEMISQYRGQIDFKMLHHDHNRGLSAARNTGTDAATGDYVYYLDSDDAMTPDCLALMAAEVEKHPEVEMVMGAHVIISDKGRIKALAACESGYVESNAWVRFQFFKCEYESSLKETAWNRLVSLGFVKRNDIRFKEGVIHEDEHWSFYVYQRLAKVSIISDATYLHYVTPNSIMTTNTWKRRAENTCLILEDLVRDFSAPFRSLQVFKCLEHFRFYVMPYLPKKQTKGLYLRFLHELLRMNQYKIAIYWFINWYHDLKHAQLYYNMIPDAYKTDTEKARALLNFSKIEIG